MASPQQDLFAAARAMARQLYPGKNPLRVSILLDNEEQVVLVIPPTHGPDFRSVNWYGVKHGFTANQAAVVKILWEAWEDGSEDVSQEYLVTETGIETDKLSQLFRDHPAWNTMIVQGSSRNTVRLSDPPKI